MFDRESLGATYSFVWNSLEVGLGLKVFGGPLKFIARFSFLLFRPTHAKLVRSKLNYQHILIA